MRIVKDKVYPNMYRIRWDDGEISGDLYNIVRAKELLFLLQEKNAPSIAPK